MALADRCDEIIELIDRVLRDEDDASRVPRSCVADHDSLEISNLVAP
jgi:hypothetical protein